MASRRLAISSLLCDGDDTSGSSKSRDSRLSQSPVVAHQPVAVRPYASPVRSAYNPARSPSPFLNVQYERQYRGEAYERSPSPASPVPYTPSRSITPLPLALQPVTLHRRTPSPPPRSQPASPEPSTTAAYERHYLEDELVSRFDSAHYRESRDFPSRHALTQHSNPAQSPPYPQYQLPFSPSSPVNIGRAVQQSRRAAPQISSYDHSRSHSQMSDSPPGLAHLSSVSPQSATMYPSHSADALPSRELASLDDYEKRNASYPQQSSFPAYRSSPTIPKSAGISGLDVLSQAATEVRERIDETRRLSGGMESRFSPEIIRPSTEVVLEDRGHNRRRASAGEEHSYASVMVHQQTHSPIAFRSDVRLQPSSPKPSPRSAPVMLDLYTSSAHPSSPVQHQFHTESPPRALKRRLSSEHSPKYSEARPVETAQPARPSMHANTSSRVQMCSVSVPEKTSSIKAEPSSQLSLQSNLSPRQSADKREAMRDPPQSQPMYQSEARHTIDRKPPSSTRTPSGTGPPTRVPISTGRRSPPRSRPKPKKPGSAALASTEQAVQDPPPPKLADNERTDTTAKSASSSLQTLSATSKPRRVPSSKTSAVVVRKQEEEEDSTDFFLSAISSPKESQEAKMPASELDYPNVQIKQHSSRHRKSWVKPARDSPLTMSIDVRRSPTADILDEIIGSPYPEEKTSAHAKYDSRGDNFIDDIDSELANAVATTPSEDEDQGHNTFGENEEPDADAMEVDVENELLSLLDDPSDVASRPVTQVPLPTHNARHAMPHLMPASFGRSSMPPPDVLNAVSLLAKPGKKDSAKTKGKAKAKSENAPGTSKSTQETTGDGQTEKVHKPKAASKPRPPKGQGTDKTKQSKSIKDTVTPAPIVQTSDSLNPSGGGTPVDEFFPLVTSSGRMVTKSKKIAASAATTSSLHPTAHSKKKPSAIPVAHSEGNESRSRSHSVMPRASVDPEGQREKSAKTEEPKARAAEEADTEEDDKLYCICKTKYDEDRVMIACDRCDEWYHTQCINMPELDIDLVDQFICPVCVGRNPNMQLHTTYKQRCFAGLNHPKPNSADACHKPSRGAFSKYCSDECGVRFMHRKVQTWASKGGDVQSLWAAVKDAKRREGVVTAESHRTIPLSILAVLQNRTTTPAAQDQKDGTTLDSAFEPIPARDKPANAKLIKSLQVQLESISKQRESWKKEMDLIIWRERVLILAAERANKLKECGWDQRLCFGDEEIIDFGEGVLDSYDESAAAPKNEEENGMDVDEQVGEGEWWCRGKQKCDRHGGWQKLRIAEIKMEKEMKEDALVKLTSREREIRGRIEDILHPHSSTINLASAPKLTFKSINGRKISDDGPKKGKKKNLPV